MTEPTDDNPAIKLLAFLVALVVAFIIPVLVAGSCVRAVL
jgi:hypothetical protein